MGQNESSNKRIEEQEKFVNKKIESIELNYPNEWNDLIKNQGIRRIKGKIRALYNNNSNNNNYFNHEKYKCFLA